MQVDNVNIDANTVLCSSASFDLKLSAQSGKKVHIDNELYVNGNVGIGTDSPESALQVSGTLDGSPDTKGVHMGMENTSYAAIKVVSTATGTASIDFNAVGDTFNGSIYYSNNTDKMEFWTGKSRRMTLTSTGLGIGTNFAHL